MEYLDDRFCNLNADKLGLVRMTFSKGTNHHGEPLFLRKMVTAGDIDGRLFKTIQTIWGENLVDFHHRVLRLSYPEVRPWNESSWFRTHGDSPNQFYPAHLARFICHGVMFENFLSNRHEEAFTRDVVLPAFERVCSRFGMKPLVIRLLPEESEDDPSWTWYEAGMEHPFIEEMRQLASRPR